MFEFKKWYTLIGDLNEEETRALFTEKIEPFRTPANPSVKS
jgi:hypothetical protein